MLAQYERATPAQKKAALDSFLLHHVPGLTQSQLDRVDPVREKIKWRRTAMGLVGDHGERNGNINQLEALFILIVFCGLATVGLGVKALIDGSLKLSTGGSPSSPDTTLPSPTASLPSAPVLPSTEIPLQPINTPVLPTTAPVIPTDTPVPKTTTCVTVQDPIYGLNLLDIAAMLPDMGSGLDDSFEKGYAYTVNGSAPYNPHIRGDEIRPLLGIGNRGTIVCQVPDERNVSKGSNLAKSKNKGWQSPKTHTVYMHSRKRILT